MGGFPHFKGDMLHIEKIVLAVANVAQQFTSFPVNPAFRAVYEASVVSTGTIFFGATKLKAEGAGRETGPITAVADSAGAPGSRILVTAANTLPLGAFVTLSGSTGYDGTFRVLVVGTTNFEIAGAFVATGTGTYAEFGSLRKLLGIGSSVELALKNVEDVWFVSDTANDEIGLVVEEIT